MLKTMKTKISNWFKRIPIGKKITLLYGGIFAVVLILSSIFIFTNLWYYYRDSSKRELLATMKNIEKFITDGGEVTSQNIHELIKSKNIEARIIVNSGNEPPMATNPGIAPDVSPFNDKIKLKSYEYMGDKYLYCEKTVKYLSNTYVIQVFGLYKYEAQILKLSATLFVGINIFGILAAYLIGVLISRKFLKPITEITETAEKISSSDLNRRINGPEADDEIRRLTLTFNDMIKRLESSFENQRQFISDASHELRTPISVIQGYANLLSRWGKGDPEVLDESITSIKSETQYMSDMINQMLYLARGEKNEKEIVRTTFSLNELLADIARDFEVVSENVDFAYNEHGSFYMYGDENLIKQLVYIFLENAIKYGKDENKQIRLSLKGSENQDPVIEIEDNGKGIAEEDLPRIFERFYRGDKSRNKEVPGTGLGLSIAKWIVDVHKGKIDVKSTLGEGTTFSITLPKATPTD